MRTDHDEKRNPRDLLGIGDSDAEEIQSSDEEDGRSRATNISRPRVKRQRLESTRTDENETDNDDEESKGERKECQESEGGVVDERFSGKLQNSSFSMDPEKASNVDTSTADDDQFITNPSKLKPLTKEELAASKAATAKTGVVYLSRIPPFMKPQKVRDLLARFGTIGRVFLTPENSKTHTKRVRFGGNKKRNFVEGWVEFSNKKDAKLCAETLNTNNIGGKKGSYYYDDVWNIKYLPKFKWHHLQAQIAYENASRQAKLRAEIAHETKANKTYLRNVERAKMVENMQKKRKAIEGHDGEERHQGTSGGGNTVEVRRQFRQHKVKGKASEKEGTEKNEKVKILLSKIF